ncbi:MAG: SRPBCC family protein, partial [Nakamurella sp.]
MINVERTFDVRQPVDVVVNYLKDFANATEWDPGTKSCTQESPGPVQVGTTWHNVSELKGKETELTYRLAELSDNRVLLIGENKTATSRDDITVKPADGG